jgi:type III secretory pathway component EscR
MDRNTILWTLTVFFGATVAFGIIRNATEDQSSGVTIGIQAIAMLVIIGVVVAVVRYQERRR